MSLYGPHIPPSTQVNGRFNAPVRRQQYAVVKESVPRPEDAYVPDAPHPDASEAVASADGLSFKVHSHAQALQSQIEEQLKLKDANVRVSAVTYLPLLSQMLSIIVLWSRFFNQSYLLVNNRYLMPDMMSSNLTLPLLPPYPCLQLSLFKQRVRLRVQDMEVTKRMEEDQRRTILVRQPLLNLAILYRYVL